MDSIFDLPITPKDAAITINFMHFFPVSQWHLVTDGCNYQEARHPISIKIDIEQVGEMEWMYYIDLGVKYVGFLGQDCRFGFKISGCTESGLYYPGMMHSLLSSSSNQFYTFLNEYVATHHIINMPPQHSFQKNDMAMISPKLIESAQKKGFITFDDPIMHKINLKITKDMSSYLSVLETTATIVTVLLYNQSFDIASNGAEINKFIDIGRVKTILHKCTFKYKNESIELSNGDTISLLILVDMCVRCMVGQIWYRIKPFIQPFDEAQETFFLKSGHLFISEIVEALGSPKISNLLNPPDWDNILA